MISRVLVANRGEIAVRVIRACHDLGLEAVVVHSEPDAGSLAVELADDAVALSRRHARRDVPRHRACASAPPPRAGATRCTPATASWPSTPASPRRWRRPALTWIGPAADVIALMGDKLAARQVAADAGVPTGAGSDGRRRRHRSGRAASATRSVGRSPSRPCTAAAGRGMRVIERTAPTSTTLLAAARRESQSSFGRPEVYVERFLTRPRHVEVQLVADHHGGLVVVGDRDCSIQRRYQKLIEEAPAPRLSDAVRSGAGRGGEPARPSGRLHQRRHRRVPRRGRRVLLPRDEHAHPGRAPGHRAGDRRRSRRRADPRRRRRSAVVRRRPTSSPRGAAIEVRINAEDTTDGRFLPVPGTLRRFDPPHGTARARRHRLSAPATTLPPEYDNLIAKIAVWGEDRERRPAARDRRAP